MIRYLLWMFICGFICRIIEQNKISCEREVF